MIIRRISWKFSFLKSLRTAEYATKSSFYLTGRSDQLTVACVLFSQKYLGRGEGRFFPKECQLSCKYCCNIALRRRRWLVGGSDEWGNIYPIPFCVGFGMVVFSSIAVACCFFRARMVLCFWLWFLVVTNGLLRENRTMLVLLLLSLVPLFFGLRIVH